MIFKDPEMLNNVASTNVANKGHQHASFQALPTRKKQTGGVMMEKVSVPSSCRLEGEERPLKIL